MSKLLIRKVTVNGHLLSVKRSNHSHSHNHFPATAAVEREMHALPSSEFKRQRTESSVASALKTLSKRTCFDNLTELFDEATHIDGHSLFPTIEWNSIDEEKPELSDEDHISLRPKVSLPLKRQLNLLRSPTVLDQLHDLHSHAW